MTDFTPDRRPPPEPEEEWEPQRYPVPAWHTGRDLTLFVLGLLGTAHETLVTAGERPSLLVLFAAMMGLPAFLRADERRRR